MPARTTPLDGLLVADADWDAYATDQALFRRSVTSLPRSKGRSKGSLLILSAIWQR
jgi:hypothetical protein